MVLISVITPTKDRPEAVELCRRWFREQTYPVHEHLVIKGGTQNENIREGIRQATGDVILLADDDDHYSPDWTRWVAEAFESPTVMAAGQRVLRMHHLRAEAIRTCYVGPLAGTLSFRREIGAQVLAHIDHNLRPKGILQHDTGKGSCAICGGETWPGFSRLAESTYATHLMGLYGTGLSRKHKPERFHVPDPRLADLRGRIGTDVVDAYLAAARAIDSRTGAA